MNEFYLESLNEPALTVMKDVCGVKNGERVLIVTNPQKDVLSVSMALNDAATKLGVASTMIVQEEKTLIDFADKSVIAAIATKPDVVLSISANKLGKDEEAMKKPYIHEPQLKMRPSSNAPNPVESQEDPPTFSFPDFSEPP